VLPVVEAVEVWVTVEVTAPVPASAPVSVPAPVSMPNAGLLEPGPVLNALAVAVSFALPVSDGLAEVAPAVEPPVEGPVPVPMRLLDPPASRPEWLGFSLALPPHAVATTLRRTTYLAFDLLIILTPLAGRANRPPAATWPDKKATGQSA
jgi:hypothetical protein